MNELIKFELSGQTAFFKNPVVNKVYLTYNNIHPIVLKGLLGALIGLSGYTCYRPYEKKKTKRQLEKDLKKGITPKSKELPEFYTILKDLKVGITPIYEDGETSFQRTNVTFTNTTKQVSGDGTLIVQQNWLINPKWEIILSSKDVDLGIWEKLKDFLINGKAIYMPYLGANNHFAKINNVELLMVQKKMSKTIDSLFYFDNDNKEQSELFDDFDLENQSISIENMPIKLCDISGIYKTKPCYFTKKELKNEIECYDVKGKNIFLLGT